MNSIASFVLGFLAGIVVGWLSVLLYCALVTAGRADEAAPTYEELDLLNEELRREMDEDDAALEYGPSKGDTDDDNG